MIQAVRLGGSTSTNFIYVDLWDKFEGTLNAGTNDKPLIALRSQQTNKTKYFIPTSATYTNKQRYIKLSYIINFVNTELPVVGLIYLGTKEFPYGLYDITMWQNTSSSNLDPDGLTNVLYRGLFNLLPVGTPSVEYTEYENTQQSNVYITNTYI